jgi:hypothetical protein
MVPRIIHCPKHGRVTAPCRVCKVDRFIERVKAGLAHPRTLSEGSGPVEGDISPLQIRFRAFMERLSREEKRRGRTWKQRPRLVRCYPSELLEE